MATKLKDFDFTHQSKLTIRGGKDPYPWDQWFDGDIWQITYGEDFDSHPLMMERIIRTRIVGREGKVALRHVGANGEPWGIIVLRRTDIEGPTARKSREAKERRQAKKVDVSKPETAKKAAPTIAAKKVSKANGHAAPSKRPSKRVAASA
jgi:hypothetical protein